MHIFTILCPCRGDFLTVQKGNICASSWTDRKVVTDMSTTSQPETGSVPRRQKDGTRITVSWPLSIIDYNNFMGGVDRGDQVWGYYSCRTKCRKFYKYIFHQVFCLMSQSPMCTSSRRATVAMHCLRRSKHSGCSWQVNSLVTIVVDEELVVVLLVFSVLSLFAIIQRQSQQEGQAQEGPMSQVLQ